MSINTCHNCGDIYDTDFQMETDKDGNMVCDGCFEMLSEIYEQDKSTKHRED